MNYIDMLTRQTTEREMEIEEIVQEINQQGMTQQQFLNCRTSYRRSSWKVE